MSEKHDKSQGETFAQFHGRLNKRRVKMDEDSPWGVRGINSSDDVAIILGTAEGAKQEAAADVAKVVEVDPPKKETLKEQLARLRARAKKK
jgi:hypothetical protein